MRKGISFRRLNSASSLRSIYLIENADADAVKIGISAEPERRLRTLRNSSPSELTLLATIPGTLMDEKRLHAVLHASCIHGEWFTGQTGRALARVFQTMKPSAFWKWIDESLYPPDL